MTTDNKAPETISIDFASYSVDPIISGEKTRWEPGAYVRSDLLEALQAENAELQHKLKLQSALSEQFSGEITKLMGLNTTMGAKLSESVAENERLKATLQTISNLSDAEMRDGDGARDIARKAIDAARAKEGS